MPTDAAMRAAKAIREHFISVAQLLDSAEWIKAAEIIDREMGRMPHDFRYDPPPNLPEHIRRNGGGYS